MHAIQVSFFRRLLLLVFADVQIWQTFAYDLDDFYHSQMNLKVSLSNGGGGAATSSSTTLKSDSDGLNVSAKNRLGGFARVTAPAPKRKEAPRPSRSDDDQGQSDDDDDDSEDIF